MSPAWAAPLFYFIIAFLVCFCREFKLSLAVLRREQRLLLSNINAEHTSRQFSMLHV